MIYINTGVCTQWLSGFKPWSTALESKFSGVRVIKLPNNTSLRSSVVFGMFSYKGRLDCFVDYSIGELLAMVM